MNDTPVDISVVLPILNERENLRPLIAEIETALRPTGKSFEVIAVDDGSRDGSQQVLRELAGEKDFLRVVFLAHNYGQAAAFDAGFRHASGRTVVTMDADLQNDPADIPKMIAMLDEGYDFIAGNRQSRRDGFFHRTIPSRIANGMIRLVTKTKVRDLGCSLKVYRYDLIQDLHLYGEMHRFIAVLVEGLGARTGEMVVNHRRREHGKSKYGLTRTFKVLLDLLTVWFMRGYHTKPIYVFGGVGAILLVSSAVMMAWVAYLKLAYQIYVHLQPLFIVSMVFAVIGVQFLGMGLLAELIIRTYFESQQKSSYRVAAKIGFNQQRLGERHQERHGEPTGGTATRA